VTTENEDKVPQQQGEPSTDAPTPAPRSGGYSSERSGGFSSDRGGHSGPPRRPRRPNSKDRFAQRRKVDQFAIDGIRDVDYKDFNRLKRYMSDRGKIEPRRKTGLSAFHQRSLTTAIKRARFMALLPYVTGQSR